MPCDLVTGATGFIGRHLMERLVEDGRRTSREVRVLCRPKSMEKLSAAAREGVEIAFGDLSDPRSLVHAVEGVDRIYHCAGHVSDWGTERIFTSTNAHGTRHLLEAARAAGVGRFVHMSSIAVFGVPSPSVFDDETPYGSGGDLYSRTKIEGERIALEFHRETGLPVTVLRPPVVYGRHGTWAEGPLAMIRKKKMFLIARGKGTCHPCFIENLVDAMLLVAEHPRAVGQAYIVGDDEALSFREYFDRLAWVAEAPPVRQSIPLPLARAIASGCETLARFRAAEARPLLTHAAIDMITQQSRMSIRKIREQLGYRPRYSFDEAMRKLKSQVTASRGVSPESSPGAAGD